jgi:hypothetical protein
VDYDTCGSVDYDTGGIVDYDTCGIVDYGTCSIVDYDTCCSVARVLPEFRKNKLPLPEDARNLLFCNVGTESDETHRHTV